MGLLEEFLSKLPKTFTSKVVPIVSGCWVWVGCRDIKGYGNYGRAGKSWKAHRFSYINLVGPIEAKKELDHLCRNRACVNPAHLEPVSHHENVLRGKSGRLWEGKSHCKRGHEYTPENTHIRARGPDGRGKECRACFRLRYHAAKAKRGSCE